MGTKHLAVTMECSPVAAARSSSRGRWKVGSFFLILPPGHCHESAQYSIHVNYSLFLRNGDISLHLKMRCHFNTMCCLQYPRVNVFGYYDFILYDSYFQQDIPVLTLRTVLTFSDSLLFNTSFYSSDMFICTYCIDKTPGFLPKEKL